jgi:hypothetical protein
MVGLGDLLARHGAVKGEIWSVEYLPAQSIELIQSAEWRTFNSIKEIKLPPTELICWVVLLTAFPR